MCLLCLFLSVCCHQLLTVSSLVSLLSSAIYCFCFRQSFVISCLLCLFLPVFFISCLHSLSVCSSQSVVFNCLHCLFSSVCCHQLFTVSVLATLFSSVVYCVRSRHFVSSAFCCVCFCQSVVSVLGRPGGDVAQLVEHKTGTPLTQVQFPGGQGNFPPGSIFSADSLTVSAHPRLQSHALTSVRTLKIP